MTNCTSRKVILVPGCLLCPIYQVGCDESKLNWRREILDFLCMSGVSLVQMPCPEVIFESLDVGLSRKPHGVRYYEKLPGFKDHCKVLAHGVVTQIKALQKNGYVVKAILGIENSPTCAVDKIFTYGIGTEKRPGLFVSELKNYLLESGLAIPIIGITRHKKDQKKEVAQILELIDVL